MTIFAVIVTYNRLPLLKQVIVALQRQTRTVDAIIVVNNSATDGTKEWLAGRPDLQVIEQANTGCAGGYHVGMKKAYEQKADWIWLMDDDVLPAADCLEVLLTYKDRSECLHPVHREASGELLDEESWLNPASCSIVSNFNNSYKNGKKLWYRNTGSFEGMLVSAKLVAHIGFPDVRFFMVHDDLVYAYEASKHTNVAVVAAAVMHKLYAPRTEASHLRYLYLDFRNLWLVEEYMAKNLSGFEGYRRRRIKLKFLYAVYEIWNLPQYKNKWKAFRMLYRAYRDYKQKKGGSPF